MPLRSFEQNSEHVSVGTPTIDDESIFTKLSWHWPCINPHFFQHETARSWIFFHTLKKLIYQLFDYRGICACWFKKTNYTHQYQGQRFGSSVSYLMECKKQHKRLLTPSSTGGLFQNTLSLTRIDPYSP